MQKLFIFIFIISSLVLLSSCSLFHKHEFGEWQNESVPDCTSEGVDARYCECGEKETRPIAALGHTEKLIMGSIPSCSKTGLTNGKYCTICKEVTVPQETIDKTPHNEVIDYGRPATCENEGLTDGKHCVICGKVTLSRKKIDKLPHSEIAVPEVPATCQTEGKTAGSVCSECGLVFNGIEVIPKIAHTVVIDHGVPATCTSDGITEGSHCSACGETIVRQLKVYKLSHSEIAPTCTKWGATYEKKCLHCNTNLSRRMFLSPKGHVFENGYCISCGRAKIDFTDVSLYKSNSGYESLSTFKKGSYMQKFYLEMEKVLTEFHYSKTMNAEYMNYHKNLGDVYTVATFYYSDFGLTLAEAETVYQLFRQDHPAFYWYAYNYYSNSKKIWILTVDDYANGNDRARYNQIMYDAIEEYYYLADELTSVYDITLAYFDAIIKNNKYAYVNGNDANKELWAHSVMGGFVYGEFVCEGYAKLLQMLLNLRGVENIYVSGVANSSHAWNLVKFDDGKWYYVDATWADKKTTQYNYFCATYRDMPDHTPNPLQLDWKVCSSLPSVAKNDFMKNDILEIGEQFNIGNSIFKRSSSGGVKLVRGTTPSGGRLVYNGVVYQIER